MSEEENSDFVMENIDSISLNINDLMEQLVEFEEPTVKDLADFLETLADVVGCMSAAFITMRMQIQNLEKLSGITHMVNKINNTAKEENEKGKKKKGEFYT